MLQLYPLDVMYNILIDIIFFNSAILVLFLCFLQELKSFKSFYVENPLILILLSISDFTALYQIILGVLFALYRIYWFFFFDLLYVQISGMFPVHMGR